MAMKSYRKKFYTKEKVWVLFETSTARTNKEKSVLILQSYGGFSECWYDEKTDMFLIQSEGLKSEFDLSLNTASYSKAVCKHLRGY